MKTLTIKLPDRLAKEIEEYAAGWDESESFACVKMLAISLIPHDELADVIREARFKNVE